VLLRAGRGDEVSTTRVPKRCREESKEEEEDEEFLQEIDGEYEDGDYSAGDDKFKELPANAIGDLQSQCQYSRKEKSLGELCRRFLGLYGSEDRTMLYLDQCTRELAVERRRIYDIINILESFQVINRQAKNAYHWKGINKVVMSIERQIVPLTPP